MPVDPSPAVGKQVAKYVIESFLGEGAMGNIYRARHIDFDQVVALKVLRRELASVPSSVERFHREAKAAFQIDHPNIVRVIDFGIDSDDVPYLAMEILEGRNLATILREERPIATERIVHLMRQALAGVAAAHAVGIIHRDLKPENIMVTRITDDEGTATELVKVCDFGIARLTRDEPDADPRADVHAMGVVLYELLTGRVPFSAASAMAAVDKAVSTIPPPSSITNVHSRLEAICLRALEKDPDKRFASARSMRAALGEVQDPNALSEGMDERSSVNSPATESILPRPESLAAHALHADPVSDGRTSKSALRSGSVVGFLGLGVFAIGVAIADRNHGHGRTSRTSSSAIGERASVAKMVSAGGVESVRFGEARDDAMARTPLRTDRVATGGKAQKNFRLARPSSNARSPILHDSDLPSATDLATPLTPHVEPPTVVSTLVASNVPVSVVSAPAPAPAPLDPSRGRVRVAAIVNEGGVLRRNVHSAIIRILPRFEACYRTGLQAASFSGNAVLHLETDTAGVVVRARASMPFAPTISTCVEHAAHGLTLADVDTGNAEADVTLVFEIVP